MARLIALLLLSAEMERLLTRRDVPLPEKTLWRVLYETATRASEILALDIENLDLEARRAPVRFSTPGYWTTRMLERPRSTSGMAAGSL